ncbi:hypothetical protein OG764_33120 [Streptomyces sp. NBC_00239]
MRRVVPFTELGRGDVGRVGGKNASLGELTRGLTAAGLRVPPGFATTADAYEELLDGHGLRTRIQEQLDRFHDGAAFRWWRLPADGVGLARLEFIVAHQVKVHPMALLHPERLGAADRCAVDQLRATSTGAGTSPTGSRTGSPGSPPPAGPTPSSSVPATSRPTSTPSSSGAAPSNRWRPIR